MASKHFDIFTSAFHLSRTSDTPPKTNMKPSNEGLEDDVPFKAVSFRFHVGLPGSISTQSKTMAEEKVDNQEDLSTSNHC